MKLILTIHIFYSRAKNILKLPHFKNRDETLSFRSTSWEVPKIIQILRSSEKFFFCCLSKTINKNGSFSYLPRQIFLLDLRCLEHFRRLGILPVFGRKLNWVPSCPSKKTMKNNRKCCWHLKNEFLKDSNNQWQVAGFRVLCRCPR